MALDPEKLIAGVKAKLVTIAGVDPARVYDYRREVRDEPTARALWYSDTQGRIHAWSVTLAEPPVKSARSTGFSNTQAGQILADVGVVLEGVFGIDDAAASEKTFRALCWTVAFEFNKVGLITGGGLVAGDVAHQEAMQWERFGYLVLASMFHVHYARMTCRYTGKVSP